MSWCTSSRNQNISFENRLKFVQPKDAFRLHCKKVGKNFDFEVPTFFFFGEHVYCFDWIEGQSFSTQAKAVDETYWSHIKFLHINDQTWWRYIFFDFYFSFALSPEELWRTKKWKRLSSWRILFKVPTTSRIIEGSRSLLIFSLFWNALLLFLYFELKIEISWNSRSSKAKSSNDNFARNDVCNYIA